uniref:Uncharacterized protein n=1 Tax=Caenorhabditis japonica TaxID=281687 RepID=A0A8R1EFB4_CAEJA
MILTRFCTHLSTDGWCVIQWRTAVLSQKKVTDDGRMLSSDVSVDAAFAAMNTPRSSIRGIVRCADLDGLMRVREYISCVCTADCWYSNRRYALMA